MSILLHPLTTFAVGVVLTLLVLVFLLSSCAGPNNSKQLVADYRAAMTKAGEDHPAPGSAEEKKAIATFTTFLQSIGDADYVRENTKKAFAPDAYLNDTLVTHHGADEIEAYFLETSKMMTSYKVEIEDVARSGPNYYLRWSMTFSAPKLAGGEPVHSIGMSQIRFNEKGQVEMQQDFWDSGTAFYGHLPIAGGMIHFVKKRLSKVSRLTLGKRIHGTVSDAL